jgi:tripartite-type tricarboxylate transporter receptor subunit TctC
MARPSRLRFDGRASGVIHPNAERRKLLVAAGALGLPTLSGAGQPQPDRWPGKPIRIVVAFPPAGLTDVYARLYAAFLAAELNQQVFVDNKPGAGAVIGIDLVAKSPPDGHTLLMTTSGTVWQNRVLYSKLPYNLDKDLTPIAVFPSGPLVVGASRQLGVDNFNDLVTYARTRAISMGSYAPGSFPHMLADQTNRNLGTRIQSVHYRGEVPMWLDVAGGQVELAVGSYQAFSTVASRGVRAIGVTGTYRSPKLPHVRTLLEQGIDGRLVALEAGITLLAPGGTPEAVLQTLSRAAVDWSNTRDAARLRESLAIPTQPKNLLETRRAWERDVPVWIKLAVDLGIKLD